MIPRIHPGGVNLGGLLRYLWGPGRAEEHVNPRLVAVWLGGGDIAALQPIRPDGVREFRRLVAPMTDPLRALPGVPPDRPVWHCSIRLAPTDPTLTDLVWARIAAEFMDRIGLAPHDDELAVPWIAMRHGEDHIHLVAILARADGRRPRRSFEKLKARHAALALEQQHHLAGTAAADRTAARTPSTAEQRKAGRIGLAEPARPLLLRHVRAAAAGAVDEADFFTRLRAAGVRVRPRLSTVDADEVTGYAVAWPAHTDPAGEPIWYGGGKLAPDLTLPRLRRRWQSVADQPVLAVAGPADVYRLASAAVHEAVDNLRLFGLRHPGTGSAIATAVADLLTAVAWNMEGHTGGPATDAAQLLDRAAREAMGQIPIRRSAAVGRVRQMARLVYLTRLLADDPKLAVTIQLIFDLALFAQNLADLRAAQHRMRQAEAAAAAAHLLYDLAATARGPHWPPAAVTAAPAGRSTPTPATDQTGPDAADRNDAANRTGR